MSIVAASPGYFAIRWQHNDGGPLPHWMKVAPIVAWQSRLDNDDHGTTRPILAGVRHHHYFDAILNPDGTVLGDDGRLYSSADAWFGHQVGWTEAEARREREDIQLRGWTP